MKHKDWLENITGDSVNAISQKIGAKQRTLAAQLDENRLTPENVIKIAEQYGTHPVGALVDTGYLDKKWATSVDPLTAAQKLTDEQILEEILRRLKLPGDHREFVTPIDETPQYRRRIKQNSREDIEGNTSDYSNFDHDNIPYIEEMVASQESEFIPPDDEFIP